MAYVRALRAYYRVVRGAFGLALQASRTATTERDWTEPDPLRFADVAPDAYTAALIPQTTVAANGAITMTLLVISYNGYVTAYDAPYDDMLAGRRVVWTHPRTLTGPQSGAEPTADVVLIPRTPEEPGRWLLICGRIRVLLDVETHEALDNWREREDRSA